MSADDIIFRVVSGTVLVLAATAGIVGFSHIMVMLLRGCVGA